MTIDEFLQRWCDNKIKATAEVRPGGKPIKHRNWNAIDNEKKYLVRYWYDNFRNELKPICWNNSNPKNFKQFVNFERV